MRSPRPWADQSASSGGLVAVLFALWLVPVGFGQPEHVKALSAQLNDSDPNVRVLAAKALGEIGGPSTVGPLIAALKDKDWRVRLSAVNALGKIKDPRTVQPLKAALEDTDSYVREGAAEALSYQTEAADRETGAKAAAADRNINLTGSWVFILTSTEPDSHEVRWEMELKQDGNKIIGNSLGDEFHGSISGSDLELQPPRSSPVRLSLMRGKIVSPNKITGEVVAPPGYQAAWTWELDRK